MNRKRETAGAATLLLASLAALGGCQRGSEPPATSADAPSAAATGPSAPPAPAAPAVAPRPTAALPAAALHEDQPPPEGVLRAYVWDCADGLTLRMRNLYRENAVSLEMHEGSRRLPQVVSASGAKYSDGSITLWTRGSEATFERAGSPAVQCRENRAQSLLADARARGVIYRGRGNEPGWTVEVGPGDRLSFVTNYGGQRYDVVAAAARGGDGADVYTANTDAGRLEVSVAREPCLDDMSGERFDHRVVVEHGDRTLRGCGTSLR